MRTAWHTEELARTEHETGYVSLKRIFGPEPEWYEVRFGDEGDSGAYPFGKESRAREFYAARVRRNGAMHWFRGATKAQA